MTDQEFNQLKRFDAVRITFGGSGATQFAVVHSWTRHGTCRVMKYSETADIWKGPLNVAAGEVIARAIDGDKARRRGNVDRYGKPISYQLTKASYERNPLAPRS